jgi:formylglycine-generating enzyme required for sulfatase activity
LKIHEWIFIMGDSTLKICSIQLEYLVIPFSGGKINKMRSHRSKLYWLCLLILAMAALACTLAGSDSGPSAKEIVPEQPVQLATLPGSAAATWTPFPTFTPYPTFTEEWVKDPTATEIIQEPQVTEEQPEIRTNPGDEAVLVYVPAGEFLMGSDAPGANLDERPAHTVSLDAFWLYRTTVTNSQYRLCLEAEACEGSLSRYPENSLPAVNVSWFDAQAYCTWAGGQLPTEAQWEKGARGTDGRDFPWGNDRPTCELANFKNCYGSKEIGVNQLSDGASPYGALHMVGNVWEWVHDWYDPDYYSVSPANNPTGPDMVEEQFRVQRGGSFESDLNTLYITIRARSKPDKVDYRKGFRCVIVE